LSCSTYRGPVSAHFDGIRFHNLRDAPHGGFGRFLKWRWMRHANPWSPRSNLAVDSMFPMVARTARGDLHVTFVNHATVLIQVDGLNILTDPIWSERASPVSFAGPKRTHPPGIRFEDLPPIDVVLISHSHYDHMDLPTLRRLETAHHPQVVVGLGNGAVLREAGLARVTELDWWQSLQLRPGIQVTGVPSQHFSGRGLFDGDRTLWLGYVIEGPAGATYFAGDTGAGPHFAQIRARFGRPRLAILPIGAYRPEWFMEAVHISPEQAVQADEILGAGTAMAMHFGTFALADDGQDEPAGELVRALARRGAHSVNFWVPRPGERRIVPSL
jgi:L-ascorbate metabolism protein UlaG (beta-lactamase superfamily)